jgi:hypothetical protein
MALRVNTVHNAAIHADDQAFIGRAKEVQVPEIPYKQSDHEGLGMIGMTQLFSGIEKMEMTIMWNSVYDDVLKKTANPRAAIKFQVRGNLEGHESGGLVSEKSLVYFITAVPMNAPGPSFKHNTPVEMESKFNVTAIRCEIDKVSQYEYDVMANILKVNGVDLMANYRKNLGLS